MYFRYVHLVNNNLRNEKKDELTSNTTSTPTFSCFNLNKFDRLSLELRANKLNQTLQLPAIKKRYKIKVVDHPAFPSKTRMYVSNIV